MRYPGSSFPCFVAVLTALLFLSLDSSYAQRAPHDVIDVSFDVAERIELIRSVPSGVQFANSSVSPAGYLDLATQTILTIARKDTVASLQVGWESPTEYYAGVEPDSSIYGVPLERQDYLSFFEELRSRHAAGDRLPNVLRLDGEDVRFVDVLYLASSILRFYDAYEYLPEVVDLKVASPRGLFPWRVPPGKLGYISGLWNNEAAHYDRNEHYQNSAMDYQMYALVDRTVGNETDPYEAGRLLYQKVHNRWWKTPYGLYMYPHLFGFPYNSFEMHRNMQGTSGIPHWPKDGLYPAAGIPYGDGGAVFTEDRGWFNAEFHADYGSDLEDNPYYYYDPVNPRMGNEYRRPVLPNDGVLNANRKLLRRSGSTTPFRAFWINAADLRHRSASSIVEAAVEGGFTAVILTAKTFLGGLNYPTDDDISRPSGVDDAFDRLVGAAQGSGIEIYAALSTLGDNALIQAMDSEDRVRRAQRFWEMGGDTDPDTYGAREYNDFFMSPCDSSYKNYLHEAISDLSGNYEIDGFVFSYTYVMHNAWANESCGLEQSSQKAAREALLTEYINDLSAHAKTVDSSNQAFVVTAPLINQDGSVVDELDEIDRVVPAGLDPETVDGMIVNINGLSWLTDEDARQAEEDIISTYMASTNVPLFRALYVSKEWQHAPEVFRGLAREFASSGFRGTVLVSNNSQEGEMGSAFVSQHYGKFPLIQFDASAPRRQPVYPNNPPTVAQSVAEVLLRRGVQSSAQHSLDDWFLDADGDSLDYSARVTDPEVAATTVSEAAVHIEARMAGQTTVTVTAEDRWGGTATASIVVKVFDKTVGATGEGIPETTFLGPNYPNPFNASTTFRYGLSELGAVELTIVDVSGRVVQRLVDKEQPAGRYIVFWESTDLPSGLYFYRLRAGGNTSVRKMILTK